MEQVLALMIGLWIFVVIWWLVNKLEPIVKLIVGILYELILWVLHFIHRVVKAPRDRAESDDATPSS